MLEISTLDDVRGNNTVIYSIKTLLERKSFPKLSIMSGVMGVGKTSVAKVVAGILDKSGVPVKIYNCSLPVDMQKINEEVFTLTPAQPKAFIFEELHGMAKTDQNALLQMFDSQADSLYIVCTTTDIGKILRPIRSRAQVWEFKLLSEKQCAQLLDDYLDSKGVKMSTASKQSLLRSCHGVPRDLIKNADFAIDGEFTSAQLDALLGNVSDELIYSIFVSLRSSTPDFISNIEELMEEVSTSRVRALHDFWLRYLLEKNGGSQRTLQPSMITTLNSIYSDSDASKISKVLLRCNSNTVLLEFLTLNMSFTGSTSSTVLGVQRDTSKAAEAEFDASRKSLQKSAESTQLTRRSIKEFKL